MIGSGSNRGKATDPLGARSAGGSLRSWPEEDWIGLEVGRGRYWIRNRIGVGGMSVVYLADDRALGCAVAIKVPTARMMSLPGFAHRFRRETQALTALAHPHIVRVLDVGEYEGRPFIVLPHLAGGSLATRLRRAPRGRAAGGFVASWLGPVADALDHIHARGVIHRDLKPANILFDPFGHPFVADFGLVKLAEPTDPPPDSAALALSAPGSDHPTRPGAILGTIPYMAVEALLGDPIDGRADQYALAVILHEAITGRRPFDKRDGTAREVLAAALKGQLAPLTRIIPDLPVDVDYAIRRALSPDPADRFEDCRSLARAVLRGWGQTLAELDSKPIRPELHLNCPVCGARLRLTADRLGPDALTIVDPARRRGGPSAPIRGVTCGQCRSRLRFDPSGPALTFLEPTAPPRAENAAGAFDPAWPTSGSLPPRSRRVNRSEPIDLGIRLDDSPSPFDSPPSTHNHKMVPALPTSWHGGTLRLIAGTSALMIVLGTVGLAWWVGRGGEAGSVFPAASPPLAPQKAAPHASSPPAVAVSDAEGQPSVAQTDAWNEPTSPPESPPRLVNSLGMEFVQIAPGRMLMGRGPTPQWGGEPNSLGKEVRFVKPFHLGTTEVTVGQFRRFAEESATLTTAESIGGFTRRALWEAVRDRTQPRPDRSVTWRRPGWEQTDDHPVVLVEWSKAVEFCEWLSARPEERRAGRRYRLPSEAEWEYACRAGELQTPPLEQEWADLAHRIRWAGHPPQAPVGPLKVGQTPANRWGLFDLRGNVAEWVADDLPLQTAPMTVSGVSSPSPLDRGRSVHVARGGSFYDDQPQAFAPHARDGLLYGPDMALDDVGFRVLLELDMINSSKPQPQAGSSDALP